ncbi:MAG: DUF1572 family protein [Bacteroidia bacterium]
MNNKSINEYLSIFKQYQNLGKKSLERLSEKELNYHPDKDSNSVALIVKHLHGNMLSRWTNFLEEDGEKTWRHRDQEFESSVLSISEVNELWETGWNLLFETLSNLNDSHLKEIVYIRSEPHTVEQAILRQIAHYSYHVGQIVYLAKWLSGTNWESLSIPKGASEAFNINKQQKK